MSIRVLVIDDNSTNRRILERMLRRWAMHPVLAEDGMAGLAALTAAEDAGAPFQLILSDLDMHGLSGIALAERVRAQPSTAHVPILLLSSERHHQEADRAGAADINGFLKKPIQQSQVREAIRAALGGVSPNRAGSDRARPQRSPHARPLQVLVAEDNPVNQKLTVAYLEREGHHVTVVNDGAEAVGRAAMTTFDVILMDIQMPVLSGLDATAQIRAAEAAEGRTTRVPIIAVTARATPADRDEYRAAGMDGCVAKPIRAADLFAAIDGLMGAKDLNRADDVGSPARDGGAELVVDYDALLRDLDGDRALVDELFDMFLLNATTQIAAMRAALVAGDARRIQSTAHTMKGSSGSLRAARVAAIARELEGRGQKQQLDEAPALIEELESAVGALAREVARLRAPS